MPTIATPVAPARSMSGDILLDAGTNELEVLVFQLAGGHYGVNVAKVREVIRAPAPTQTPGMHPSVRGMFNSRGTLIPLVDLSRHLGLGDPADLADEGRRHDLRVIVTEFNRQMTGFVIDAVEQIHRVSWQCVQQSPDLSGLAGGYGSKVVSSTTGVLRLPDPQRPGEERLVLMIDFESIADAIAMQDHLHIDSVANEHGVDRESKRIILVEDSPFMRNAVAKIVRNSGYAGLEVFPDGASAWRRVAASPTDGTPPIDAIISDIEMPLMDGLHLTRRIKNSPELSHIPVILFSSLISKDNIKKGEQVGATLQIPKPELPEMVRLVDLAVSGRLGEIRRTDAEAA